MGKATPRGRVCAVDVYTVAFRFTEPETSAKGSRTEFANVMVRIQTEEGVVGWGETSGGTTGAPVEAVRGVIDGVRPLVLGLSVFDTAKLRREVMIGGRLTNVNRLGHLACAAFDIAFWDAAGRIVELPVSRLLGGSLRETIDTFAYSMRVGTREVVEDVRLARDRGRLVVYLKVGYDGRRDVEMVVAVREALGDGVRIRLDANEAWTVPEARRMLRALDPFDIDFVEAPVDGRNVAGMRYLRQVSSIPIAANEGVWSLAEALGMIRADACDVIVVGPLWLGGLAHLQHLAAMCAASGIGYCLHSPPSSSVAMAAALQVVSTVEQLEDGNQSYHPNHLRDDVTNDLVSDRVGLRVPIEPGIGVEVDDDRVQRAVLRYETLSGKTP